MHVCIGVSSSGGAARVGSSIQGAAWAASTAGCDLPSIDVASILSVHGGIPPQVIQSPLGALSLESKANRSAGEWPAYFRRKQWRIQQPSEEGLISLLFFFLPFSSSSFPLLLHSLFPKMEGGGLGGYPLILGR